jgi:uncharacterized protein YegL
LLHALEKHDKLFSDLKCIYLYQGKPIETVLDEAKQELLKVVASCKSQNRESALELLTHLAACYMIVMSGKKFLEAPPAEQQDHLVAPHRAQMLTLYRLLHVHKKPNTNSRSPVEFWRWLVGDKQRASAVPENHLAEVLTGEGKCLTLGLLASFLAVQGVESDIVCYRKCLTEQDQRAMLPFYEFLAIQDKIRYCTFDELCTERMSSIKEAAKHLVDKHETIDVKKRCDVSQRALLIDEVDVLFGRRFYGETWDGGFKLTSIAAKRLVEYIFNETVDGRQIDNIIAVTPFRELLDVYPEELHQALEVAALSMVRNVELWNKPEPILNEHDGRIGYKEKDEVNYDLSYSNKTAFAYLAFEKEGKITSEQAAEHIGMDLFCGRFSFADLPNYYRCILGVSGTLRDLWNAFSIRHILEKDFGIRHYTYTPSIFGERQLIFREAEHVHVLNNEADWLSRIEAVIQQHKQANNSVIVFFKNETELKKMPRWSEYECLTERTDPKRRDGFIAAATAPRRVTLMTKAFGRGIDFQMPSEHQVVVVQTYLSSLVSEETQIKGRTARQGTPGQYRLILCFEHLEAKMGFLPGEVSFLQSGNGEQIKALLKSKQSAKLEAKAMGMKERRSRASQIEQETKSWECLLFDPKEPVQRKLTKLAEFNGFEHLKETHYTVILDYSYSMSGQWSQLANAFARFRQELQANREAAAASKVSVILFNSYAHVVMPTHAKVSDLQGIERFQPGGGTSFRAAFAECHRLIGRSPPHAKELILFFTDGEDCVPTQEISSMLADHKARIESITCIGFGGNAVAGSLQEIGQLFASQKILFKLTTPGDEQSLVQTFVDFATDRTIHI